MNKKQIQKLRERYKRNLEELNKYDEEFIKKAIRKRNRNSEEQRIRLLYYENEYIKKFI